MTPFPISRIALPLLALIAACGAALLSGMYQPTAETRAATTARAAAPRAVAPHDASIADATARPPVVSPRSPHKGYKIMPAFEFALVGKAGDAVIAGTAAPGAAVELLRSDCKSIRTIRYDSFSASIWRLRANLEVSTGERRGGDIRQRCGGHRTAPHRAIGLASVPVPTARATAFPRPSPVGALCGAHKRCPGDRAKAGTGSLFCSSCWRTATEDRDGLL
jgi:hypothetical protein